MRFLHLVLGALCVKHQLRTPIDLAHGYGSGRAVRADKRSQSDRIALHRPNIREVRAAIDIPSPGAVSDDDSEGSCRNPAVADERQPVIPLGAVPFSG